MASSVIDNNVNDPLKKNSIETHSNPLHTDAQVPSTNSGAKDLISNQNISTSTTCTMTSSIYPYANTTQVTTRSIDSISSSISCVSI
jgi:hypothetical protein